MFWTLNVTGSNDKSPLTAGFFNWGQTYCWSTFSSLHAPAWEYKLNTLGIGSSQFFPDMMLSNVSQTLVSVAERSDASANKGSEPFYTAHQYSWRNTKA